ncbi:putative lipid binding protein [Hibiscus syriacus]|uniref:Lipid binding protein n=1 Tax=Hibiscus syriacus TaxID=106335 RepID=A0A6A2XJ14_HIBSY|nr:leucine-rich repeat receptor-like protein kinase TDR [Hibiscus syriacus]KAE8675823.1 putative lipid binding protein [Hibiscus syriacus]
MEIFLWPHLKLLLSSMLIAAVLAADPYSDALLSFKSEVIDHLHSLDDWLVRHGENRSGKVHACSWSGIKCDDNSTVVIGLDLSTKKLGGKLPGKQFSVFTELVELNISQNAFSGEIPVEIFNLTGLRSLDISRNNFSGHFPGGISGLRNLVVLDAFSNSFSGPLPVELSELESLKVLNLAGSYFNGPIPSAYGSFERLEFLHLAGNFLSGNIPPELGNLQTVTHMEIGYNSYEGNIPWQLGNMSELQYLDIAGANLSGSIPRQLSNLTKLQSLFLFRNQLTGLIPWEFSRILPLTNLDLSDNLISGPIPQSFSELKNLRLLSLMYNEMNGTIPDGIAELPSLDTLFIWNNFFTGSLPRNLGTNSKLRWLDVSTNSFIGSIPPHICAGGELFKLILFSNKFTGNLSPLSNCSSLVRIRLEDNSFSGEISLTLSHLPDVTYIDFSRNRFTGGIPSDIFQASKLQYFNVSNNPELGGVVPEEIWSLPGLQNFSASSCNISGNLPPFRSCKSMLLVELQMNNMSGVVPKSISNCKTLEIINLASNQLIGHIPEELASLPALSVVDLSQNNFSGSIPGEFGKSTNLLLLNVSFNDISGSIPSEKVLQSMDRSSYAGNPELCGAPLRSCSPSMAIFGSKGTGKLRLVLLLSAGVAILISALVFWLVYLRKGNKGQWKMDSFIGLPQFKANDVLRSFDSKESMDELPPLSATVCKAVLPTGITVLVKKIEWEPKRVKVVSEFITQMGNARHRNLTRLLGFCYNKYMAYILYDYLPNGNLAEKVRIPKDWSTKCRIIIGIAKGLCFLHHDCNPVISHGDLKSSNIVFDDNFEPRIADFGFKYLIELTKGQCNETIKDELHTDIYKFGEIILEILTNGRLINGGENIQSKPKDALLREICNENEATDSTNSLQDEIQLFVDVALLCTRSRPADRPSMKDALKLLSGLKGQGKR